MSLVLIPQEIECIQVLIGRNSHSPTPSSSMALPFPFPPPQTRTGPWWWCGQTKWYDLRLIDFHIDVDWVAWRLAVILLLKCCWLRAKNLWEPFWRELYVCFAPNFCFSSRQLSFSLPAILQSSSLFPPFSSVPVHLSLSPSLPLPPAWYHSRGSVIYFISHSPKVGPFDNNIPRPINSASASASALVATK